MLQDRTISLEYTTCTICLCDKRPFSTDTFAAISFLPRPKNQMWKTNYLNSLFPGNLSSLILCSNFHALFFTHGLCSLINYLVNVFMLYIFPSTHNLPPFPMNKYSIFDAVWSIWQIYPLESQERMMVPALQLFFSEVSLCPYSGFHSLLCPLWTLRCWLNNFSTPTFSAICISS